MLYRWWASWCWRWCWWDVGVGDGVDEGGVGAGGSDGGVGTVVSRGGGVGVDGVGDCSTAVSGNQQRGNLQSG